MSDMIKVMISQPMAGKTSDEIAEERKEMAELLNEIIDGEYEIMDTTVPDYGKKTDLECFAESIKFMSQADALVMGIGWENARGCQLEHEIAKQYDVDIIYLDNDSLNNEKKFVDFGHKDYCLVDSKIFIRLGKVFEDIGKYENLSEFETMLGCDLDYIVATYLEKKELKNNG